MTGLQADYILEKEKKCEFNWSNGEELVRCSHSPIPQLLKLFFSGQRMVNSFKNDNAHISIKWLLSLITGRGLNVQHLLRITHLATSATHYLVLLADGQYSCDCCMGLSLGVPCRHYFQALTSVKGLTFHLNLVRPR